MSETCLSVCWMEPYDRDAQCDLERDHDGPHVDNWEGWEW